MGCLALRLPLDDVSPVPVRRAPRATRARVTPATQLLLPLWWSEADAIRYYTGSWPELLPARVLWEFQRVLRVWRGGPEAEQAIEELVAHAAKKVQKIARRFERGDWERDDVVADVRLKLIRVVSAYRYRKGASLLAMLDMALPRYCIQELRKRDRRIRSTVDVTVVADDSAWAAQMTASSHEEEMAEIVTDSVDGLSSYARALLAVTMAQGELTSDEAAKLGVPRNCYQDARAELVEWLRERMER